MAKRSLMPAWSTVIAAHIVRRLQHAGLPIEQGRLQRLVYVAHGWRLAASGQPLTGDRPEAWPYGPVYRRLAEVLAPFGSSSLPQHWCGSDIDPSELDPIEHDLIHDLCQSTARLPMERLSAITRGEGSPWQRVYASGMGCYRDIGHRLIAEQFRTLPDDAWRAPIGLAPG
jgi:uncharacterized phage-associated protein